MYYQWNEINWWPSEEEMRLHCPGDFKKYSPTPELLSTELNFPTCHSVWGCSDEWVTSWNKYATPGHLYDHDTFELFDGDRFVFYAVIDSCCVNSFSCKDLLC